jgi:hypothetical protein
VLRRVSAAMRIPLVGGWGVRGSSRLSCMIVLAKG